MRSWKLLILLAGLAACLPALPAGADVGDFDWPVSIRTGDSVYGLAVDPSNRFVLAIDPAASALRFLDTWDFTMLAGATAEVSLDSGNSDVPLCVAVSPDGNWAYAGLDTGWLAVVDISGIHGVLPWQSLLAAPDVNFYEVAGVGGVYPITVASDRNGKTDNYYLLMGAPTEGRLYQARMLGGGTLAGTVTAWPDPGNPLIAFDHTPLGLASGDSVAFELYSVASGMWLQAISCDDTLPGCVRSTDYSVKQLDAAPDAFFGLAAEPGPGNYVVTADWSSGELVLVDTENVDGMTVKDTVAIGTQPLDLAVMGSGLGRTAMVLAAGDDVDMDRLAGSDISATRTFSGATVGLTKTGAMLVAAAASDGADRYAYVGGNLGPDGLVYPFTANPLVDGLATVEGQTVDNGFLVTDGFTVTFSLSNNPQSELFDYQIYKDETFGTWNNAVYTSPSPIADGDSQNDRVSANLLNECQNVLTVIATGKLSGRQGRMATTVFKDTVPSAQAFSVAFGDKKLVISFTATNLCDFLDYRIYYGTDPNVADLADLITKAAYWKTLFPAGGDAINETITGLVNGTQYFVWVVIEDQSGKVQIGNPGAGVPQPTLTLTDLTGEDGGVNCLPSLGARRRGDPWSLLLFMVPLLVAGAYHAKRRWAR